MSGPDPGSRLEEILARQGLTEQAPETQGQEDEAPAPDHATPTPDHATPLFALLQGLERDVGIDRIDRVWVFPPRRMERGETAVVVVAAFQEPRDHRRRVYAAHYTAPADTAEPRLALDEYGTAPADRVGRLVEDVVERLNEQPAAPPQPFHVDGDPSSWNALLHTLAERNLEQRQKAPRLRR